ncbi:uncharacterized protein LOC124720473 [Schistocerca piceifrons]|uniref:uncharacterized protein LOC124720473 n=1 Tax=Schistocerca piceifrons TaxID=274613 RepID=UPI001F5F336A|nr:uncharacterized protein LOC124720473 [Schistocerca piceifrons]
MFFQNPEQKRNSVNNNSGQTATIAIDADRRCGNACDIAEDVDLITRFCMPVCSRDTHTRELALDVIEKTVEGWLDGYGSPRHTRMSLIPPSHRLENFSTNGHCYTDTVSSGDGIRSVPKEYLSLVTLHLPALLRLSVNCPFLDVRDKCKRVLKLVQERGLPVPHPTIHGPSAYIPPDEVRAQT